MNLHMTIQHLGDSKVLQYFGNERHNLSAPFVFTDIVKLTNQLGQWDAELAWHSEFASLALESKVFGLHDLVWSSRFLQPEQDFLIRLVTVLCSIVLSHFAQLMFLLLPSYYGGARGVVVIAVGNEHGDTSSNPGRDWLHFT